MKGLPVMIDHKELHFHAMKSGVPDHLIGGLLRYLVHHIHPGDCLTAILENDLMEAFGRADIETAIGMRHILIFLYNYVPKHCYGNKEKVANWLKGDS